MDKQSDVKSAPNNDTYLTYAVTPEGDIAWEWNVSSAMQAMITRHMKQPWHEIPLVMRTYTLSSDDREAAYEDFPISDEPLAVNRTRCGLTSPWAELGYLSHGNPFIPILRCGQDPDKPFPIIISTGDMSNVTVGGWWGTEVFDGYGLGYKGNDGLPPRSDDSAMGRPPSYAAPSSFSAALSSMSAALSPFSVAPSSMSAAPLPSAVSRGCKSNFPAVLMLSWEYPPHVVGGLAASVEGLSRGLSRLGWEVHVLTIQTEHAPAYQWSDGVHIHREPDLRSATPLPFMEWVFAMNLAFLRGAERLTREGCRFGLIHAHDWLTGAAAAQLKQSWKVPLAATVHSTEAGRSLGHQGSRGQMAIREADRALAYEADHVLVCSRYMAAEIFAETGISVSKLTVVRNGVDAEAWAGQDAAGDPKDIRETSHGFVGEAADLSSRFEPAGAGEQHIVFLGRLVHEKGAQYLLRAMPLLLRRCPQARLTLAGAGPYEPQLRALAAELGLAAPRVRFAGFAGPAARRALLAGAAVVAVPSLYEPFGLVALEAMAAGRPLVACASGGLTELVEHGVDGLLAAPRSAEALAEQLAAVLGDGALAARLAAGAQRKALSCGWAEPAAEVSRLYARLLN
ncbi:glycosyltransferase family 4 protein [Paenibacillus swuensis]|uniref:glycosyltransferase family 4 protein n=1 Tax=Paenibacillus swuensis TaxID=1178515 RepID=UPI0018D2F8A1|nr:glycosyltransferase family 4 protein [Paenibacillus swuensis]